MEEEVEGDVGCGGMSEEWKKKYHEGYSNATLSPFISSIMKGTVNLSSFKRWLGQDYIFVRAFVAFLASVLLKAWKESDDDSDMDVLLGGMASLNDEISWFKKEASRWGILLTDIVPQKANEDYCRFLESMISPEVNYTVAVTAFWAIEVVYQQGFSYCVQGDSKTPAELMETCQRWGNEGFRQYCLSLQKIVNRNLAKAPEDVLKKAEEVFCCVLDHEIKFWEMSDGKE